MVMWKQGQKTMIRKYEVYHKDDPSKSILIRTVRRLTAGEAKEKAVKNGLFKREMITELRVKKKE
jgi:hypothetical protein